MDGLKQRVVGALVIVSLAVIFLPMIFDEPHQPSKTQLIPIPVQSELPVITLNSPQKPKFKLIEPSDSSDASEQQTSIPEEDVIDDQAVESQTASNTESEVKKSEEGVNSNPVEVVKTAANEKPAPTVFKEKELSNVWMVQLGTFGNHENAYKLRDSLRKDGFDGHTTKVEKDKKQLVRVFSGPYADKGHADKIKKQLDKKYKLNTLVVHFK